jgi:hypothetical protein
MGRESKISISKPWVGDLPWLIEGRILSLSFTSDGWLDFWLCARSSDHVREGLSEPFEQLIRGLLRRLSIAKHGSGSNVEVSYGRKTKDVRTNDEGVG